MVLIEYVIVQRNVYFIVIRIGIYSISFPFFDNLFDNLYWPNPNWYSWIYLELLWRTIQRKLFCSKNRFPRSIVYCKHPGNQSLSTSVTKVGRTKLLIGIPFMSFQFFGNLFITPSDLMLIGIRIIFLPITYWWWCNVTLRGTYIFSFYVTLNKNTLIWRCV